MKVHIVMHESFESPAAIEMWAKNKNHKVSYTRLYQKETFPEVLDFDFLVVMGGPQSPATTQEECPYFDAVKEKLFVKQSIDAGKLVFGVCLGAQFIGEALGASFEHSPEREIGVFDITLTEEGRSDAIFKHFPSRFQVGHWHGDMPGITPESKVLATSDGCPRQVVRYSEKVYGFQSHWEFTRDAIKGMIVNNAHELEQYQDRPYIETEEELKSHDYSKMNTLLFQFLDALVLRSSPINGQESKCERV